MSDTPSPQTPRAKALSLFSGGLDSQLAVCVLRKQGIHVEGITFSSPFFTPDAAMGYARELNLTLHVIEFTPEILNLLHHPPHGFGSCMNPCVDCHATMIRKAGETLQNLGFDFIATGEVLGQRPMSQRRDALNIVQKSSGLADKLLRPLSALLLPETEPERLGLVDRSQLLGLSGRNRKPQLELAKAFGITHFPPPAGGCLLTEPNYTRRLKNLQEHEGLQDTRLINLLTRGRIFRLPGGTLLFLGRNKADNDTLRQALRGGDVLVKPVNRPGATLLAIKPAEADLPTLLSLCAAYSDGKPGETITISQQWAASRPESFSIEVTTREPFQAFML